MDQQSKINASETSETNLEMPDLPLEEVPFFAKLPEADRLWGRIIVVKWVLLALYLLNKATYLPLDLWFLESIDLESVFWINFSMGAKVFVVAFIAFAAAIITPAFVHNISANARRRAVHLGLMVGIVAGYFLCYRYRDFLLLFNGEPFGEVDPVFHYDIGFFVFFLPSYWTIWVAAMLCAASGFISSAACANLAGRGASPPEGMSRFSALLGRISTPCTALMVGACGVLIAVAIWLRRYSLLVRDNKSSSVYNGAEFLDVTGVFSTLVDYHVSALVALSITIALLFLLRHLHRSVSLNGEIEWRRPVKRAIQAILILLVFDFAFTGVVMLRDLIFVIPNEPVIQFDYIGRHIAYTRKGFDLDKIEVVELIPKDVGDPLPDVDALLQTPTIKNAPLWPGFINYLEFHIDPQHKDRIVQQRGDTMIYGPTYEVFRQQEKYRAYYDFLNVDSVRYTVNGEKQLYASAVREAPLHEPNPWLAWWGQRFMLFTHGYGLTMADVAGIDPEGEPVYTSKGVPAKAKYPILHQEQQGIYYGEGSFLMGFSNVRKMKELDYPTAEGRAEIYLPPDVKAGIHVDSLLKRLVLGWRGGEFFQIVFSDLIGPETRVHYYRQPLNRLEKIAPFLYLDTNPWAVTVNGRIVWMVNALTTTDRYPYSRWDMLGDKAISRTQFLRPFRRINYARDTVKAVVDAYTGQVRAYKISDEPIIKTWSGIYPGMFVDGEKMPQEIRDHIQYPKQFFHTQFDDVYIYYHQDTPIYFFNMEDVWDDADEVIGPIMDHGRAIVWSIEPYHWIVDTGEQPLPSAKDRYQFAMSLVSTPEGARNLRAIPIALMDGEDYGRLISLQVPKPHFYLGPEQADSAIDQQPKISEQISWWNRQGNDVIRGHTITLVVQGEVLYVEPIFIRSQQNPVTQMKRVIVVFRGNASMGDTLEQALRLAVNSAAEAQKLAKANSETGDPKPVKSN